MNGVSEANVRELEARAQRLLDGYVNQRYVLPKSKNQLQVWVELYDDPEAAEAVKVFASGSRGALETKSRGALETNQRRWFLDDPQVWLLEELLHFVGLRDEYVDKEMLWRRESTASGVHDDGPIMGDAFPEGKLWELPPRYLELIEQVVDSGPVLQETLADHSLLPSQQRDPRMLVRATDAPVQHVASAAGGLELELNHTLVEWPVGGAPDLSVSGERGTTKGCPGDRYRPPGSRWFGKMYPGACWSRW